ncbi:MAG TPA: arginine--tRNA ligase [Anaerolineae bacterium]|nr:arginine--tRNA ligase [Anaerolineae bacterium]
MKALTTYLTELMGKAFEEAGFAASYGTVVRSNRPDLAQFQCNGALAAAGSSQPRQNPRALAQKVVEAIPNREIFAEVSLAGPGFINLSLTDAFLVAHVAAMAADERLGVPAVAEVTRTVLDYGGANVAKQMHVGHLRAAIIGDSLRRIFTFLGEDVVGDIHLGDWGTQMGLLMNEIEREMPDLPYFDESFEGEYPAESPVSMADFAVLYPRASSRAKAEPEVQAAARETTLALQSGHKGYYALWRHIVEISIEAIKADIERLGVHFDLWLGESDAERFIEPMVAKLLTDGYATVSEGATIVEVAREDDKKEIPPLMLKKSDGAVLYGTTDLATIVQRIEELEAKSILYVVDQRQSMHFEQVFRGARVSGIAEGVNLEHLGFGTMNGPDGKPFKTRAGGVMTLNALMDMVYEKAEQRLAEVAAAADYDEEERAAIAHMVSLAALKYADLMNQRQKDYVFDLERFSAFEGHTGPYLLYTVVRTKSILRKAAEQGLEPGALQPAANEHDRNLMLVLAQFPDMVWLSYEQRLPSHIADYAYQLAGAYNQFYRACHILNEEDGARQAGWLGLVAYFLAVMEKCLFLLGIETPERM